MRCYLTSCSFIGSKYVEKKENVTSKATFHSRTSEIQRDCNSFPIVSNSKYKKAYPQGDVGKAYKTLPFLQNVKVFITSLIPLSAPSSSTL